MNALNQRQSFLLGPRASEEFKQIVDQAPEESKQIAVRRSRRSRVNTLPRLSEVGGLLIGEVLELVRNTPESYFFGKSVKELEKKLTYNEAYQHLNRLIIQRAGKQSDLNNVVEEVSSNESSQNKSVSAPASKTHKATFNSSKADLKRGAGGFLPGQKLDLGLKMINHLRTTGEKQN